MRGSPLFNTVAPHDNLHFWQGTTLDVRRDRDFTGLDVNDLACITGLAKPIEILEPDSPASGA